MQRIRRSNSQNHGSTRSHGQTVSSPLETSRSRTLGHLRVQQRSSADPRRPTTRGWASPPKVTWTWNSKHLAKAHEREVELRELQDQSAAQPQLLKAQWKNQTSQQATYKAEIHALNTEIANMAEKSELQATRSAKMCSIDSPRATVEAAPENVLNSQHSWPMPLTIMESTWRINDTDEGNDRRSAGPPVAYGPSPPMTQRYAHGSPDLSVAPAQWGDPNQCESEVRDFSRPCRTTSNTSWWLRWSRTPWLEEWRIADCSTCPTVPSNTVFEFARRSQMCRKQNCSSTSSRRRYPIYSMQQ